MKYGSTFLMKLVIIFISLGVLALCCVAFPALAIDVAKTEAAIVKILYPILIGMSLAAIPFFIALFHTWKLLRYIDSGSAFSTLSVIALKKIKYCAFGVAGIYAVTFPFFYSLAQHVDPPGLMGICVFLIGAALVIATFAAVLQRLLQEAIAIKTENDLTV
ncbi:DUF2975 domain-containing protein [Listeria booriae]|uniref:DUF2975 domain-containing protein n=1 Tax=Listeria booriae TaxID=1552123 RepID=A0A7X0WFA7_9LIST|nr:DUF2975 domain-containing protein [Listeria booriae]MBC1332764.1 DUF2975 domain-containing protein [Listeria booriae]MBC2002529.1 DUF2975 domain-containing protein [Listeria booriae]MBC2388164.1 DUF2975 domain-containing protein [Listeria booriae]